MDPSLKDYLDKAFADVKNQSAQQHEQTRREVGTIRRATFVLWQQVFGSDPPPAGPGEDPAHVLQLKPEDMALMKTHPKRLDKPLEHKVSSHDMDIAGLHGTVIAIDSKVSEAMTELQKQSKKMAIGRKGKDFLFSAEGMKSVGTAIAALTGLVTAIGTAYALFTGRLPMPNDQPAVKTLPAVEIHAAPLPSSLPAPDAGNVR